MNVCVTGAFSYTGRFVSTRLLDAGHSVRTLTSKRPPTEGPLRDIPSHPLTFCEEDRLTRFLDGTDVLINTYWIRFERGENTFARAVENSRSLFAAAQRAGVRRIVHVSIANPGAAPELPYYAGKQKVEEILGNCGVEFAIARPTVLFGHGDVLINNIAWLVRRFPFFLLPGCEPMRIQPVQCDDYADLLIRLISAPSGTVCDAVGPERFTFRELVQCIASAVGRKVRPLAVPARFAWMVTTFAGWYLRDVVLTWEEVLGLHKDLLVSSSPPTCETRLTEWLGAHASEVGATYSNELTRHFRP